MSVRSISSLFKLLVDQAYFVYKFPRLTARTRRSAVTRTIDIPTFQAAVVRNCSPTLAGIKPASLFTYPRRLRQPKRKTRRRPYRRATLSPARRHSPMQPRAPATRDPYERFGLAPLRSAHLCVPPCGPHAIPLRPPRHDGACRRRLRCPQPARITGASRRAHHAGKQQCRRKRL